MTECWLLIAGQSCWRCGVPNVVILGVEFGVVEAGELCARNSHPPSGNRFGRFHGRRSVPLLRQIVVGFGC